MKGVELAARFSYITSFLRYCGPEAATNQFISLFDKLGDEEEITKSLKKFESLYPYTKAMADKSGIPFNDYKVMEAYWIGNELLDQFSKSDMQEIINKLMMRGLPKSMAEELKKNMPEGALPHHNFHVLYVGVGNVAHTVETNLASMDNCRVSSGKVLDVLDDLLIVQTNPLNFQDNKFYIGKEETKSAKYLKNMLPDVKTGDVVALHWGFACMKLTNEQHKNLESYTQKLIDVRNSLF